MSLRLSVPLLPLLALIALLSLPLLLPGRSSAADEGVGTAANAAESAIAHGEAILAAAVDPDPDTDGGPDLAPAAEAESAEVGAPHWPLGLSTRYLTGNFMEPRGGRFHAGLDLKTNSRTGYPVHAVHDGWIARLRYTPGGYGKAIYLRGDDGRTYVYGHLDRLADGLRGRVRAAQQERGGYAVDLWLAPGEVRVTRGEVLALSGQSATLGPHLHFEVRGPDGQPHDPQAHGFAVRDTIAPEILVVRVVNLDGVGPPSLVHGDGELPLAGRLPEVRTGHGRLRMSARVVERSDHLRYRLGPHRIELRVAGRPVLVARNDSLRWEHNRQQRLEYVDTDLGRERWLWRDPRTALAGREASPWLTGPALPPGRHELELLACDRAGNTSRVAWTLVVAGPADDPAAGWGGWAEGPDVRRDRWQVDLRHPDLVRGRGPDGLQWAAAPLLEPVAPHRLAVGGLEPLGLPVQYRVDLRRPLLDQPRVALPAVSRPLAEVLAATEVALYVLDDGAWDWVGPVAADGAVDLPGAGVYGVLRDGAPPVIATAPVARRLVRQPPRQAHGVTLPRWPVVRIPVGDHGSGVDWSAVEVTLDGAPLVAEPDPPRDRILVELPDASAAGLRRLAVVAADRAGHVARVELRLELVDPEPVDPEPVGGVRTP